MEKFWTVGQVLQRCDLHGRGISYNITYRFDGLFLRGIERLEVIILHSRGIISDSLGSGAVCGQDFFSRGRPLIKDSEKC